MDEEDKFLWPIEAFYVFPLITRSDTYCFAFGNEFVVKPMGCKSLNDHSVQH